MNYSAPGIWNPYRGPEASNDELEGYLRSLSPAMLDSLSGGQQQQGDVQTTDAPRQFMNQAPMGQQIGEQVRQFRNYQGLEGKPVEDTSDDFLNVTDPLGPLASLLKGLGTKAVGIGIGAAAGAPFAIGAALYKNPAMAPLIEASLSRSAGPDAARQIGRLVRDVPTNMENAPALNVYRELAKLFGGEESPALSRFGAEVEGAARQAGGLEKAFPESRWDMPGDPSLRPVPGYPVTFEAAHKRPIQGMSGLDTFYGDLSKLNQAGIPAPENWKPNPDDFLRALLERTDIGPSIVSQSQGDLVRGGMDFERRASATGLRNNQGNVSRAFREFSNLPRSDIMLDIRNNQGDAFYNAMLADPRLAAQARAIRIGMSPVNESSPFAVSGYPVHAGGHINQSWKNMTPDEIRKQMELFQTWEPYIYPLHQPGVAEHAQRANWAAPTADFMSQLEGRPDIYKELFSEPVSLNHMGMAAMQATPSKYNAVNWRGLAGPDETRRIEFRYPEGSVDPEDWIKQMIPLEVLAQEARARSAEPNWFGTSLGDWQENYKDYAQAVRPQVAKVRGGMYGGEIPRQDAIMPRLNQTNSWGGASNAEHEAALNRLEAAGFTPRAPAMPFDFQARQAQGPDLYERARTQFPEITAWLNRQSAMPTEAFNRLRQQFPVSNPEDHYRQLDALSGRLGVRGVSHQEIAISNAARENPQLLEQLRDWLTTQ